MWVGKVQQTGASTKSFIGERENRFQVSDTQKLSHINKEKASLSGDFEIVFLQRIIYNGIINTIFKF